MKKILNWKWLVFDLVVISLIAGSWWLKPGYVLLMDFSWGRYFDLVWWRSDFFWKAIVVFFSYAIPFSVLGKLFISLSLLVNLRAGRAIASRFSSDWTILALASLFFLFNPFVYNRLAYGQIGVVLAVGFLGLTAAQLISWNNDPRLKNIVWAGVYAGLAILFAAQFAFFVAIICLGFMILGLSRMTVLPGRIKILLHFLLVVSIILAINSNWIIGIVSQNVSGNLATEAVTKADLVAFQTSGESGFKALTNVVMMSGFWAESQSRYTPLSAFSGWGISFAVLAFFLIIGLYAGLKSRRLRPLSVMVGLFVILSIGLGVGIRLPFARNITLWLFDNFPFYRALRDTEKWTALLVVLYSVLLSFGLKSAFDHGKVRSSKEIIVVFLAGIIILQAPFLLFGLSGQVRAVAYPVDWYQVDERIAADGDCRGQILYLPWHQYQYFRFVKAVIGNPMGNFFSCSGYSGTNMEYGGIYDKNPSAISLAVREWLPERGRTDMLRKFPIQYIIMAKEVDWRSYNWLNGLPSLDKIAETDNLIVYRVSDFPQN